MRLSSQADSCPQTGTTSLSRTIVVAKKEFTHAVRSGSLRGLFVLSLAATVIVFRATSGEPSRHTADATVGLLGLPFQLLAPIAAILTGCFTVVGERETGSLRLLLALPLSRIEVVLGKFLGTFTAITVGIAATVAFAIPVSFLIFGSAPYVPLVGLGVTTALLAGAFLGFATGISAAVSTRKRAIGVAVGSYFTLAFLWELVVAGIHYVVTQTLPERPFPAWILVLNRFNPIEAYAMVAEMLGATTVAPLRVSYGLLGSGSGSSIAEQSTASAPVYLSDHFVVLVFVLWIVTPVAIGAVRFRRAELR